MEGGGREKKKGRREEGRVKGEDERKVRKDGKRWKKGDENV